jgi:polyhydroxybutyrate depolymerase
MRKLRLLLAVAVAVLSMLAATSAAVAKEKKVGKPPVKSVVKKKKPVAKTAAKPAAKPTQPTAAAKPSTDVQQRIAKAGDHRFSIQHGGLARTYRVHVPASYDAADPAPLLVALHSGGMDKMADDGVDSLTRQSDSQGFIAVFPDAYSGKGKKASWNAGDCCGDARELKVDDVGFIRQVVTNVFRQASVDRERIYAAGMSDGGMMAYRLACDLPGLFKGVASVGGTDHTTSTCAQDRPVSVLHIHAMNDPRVPVAGASATAAKWAALNGCSARPRRILEKSGAYCEAHSYCRGGTEVQLCVTETGGHSWPGATAKAGALAPSQAIAATPVVWEFLVSH